MKLFKSQSEKGQSMAEMAIIAPVLIFFTLGIFEVGAAVRNYLTLVNVNREITRFAVRPGYLNFSTVDSVGESYNVVKEWSLNSVSAQLDLDFTDTGNIADTGNSTMIISHLVIDTGLPCENIATDPDLCDCEALGNTDYRTAFTKDDIIVHPGLTGQDYQAERFGPPETVTGVRDTRLDYEAMIADLASKNNEFNCEIIKRGGIPASNNIIVTELFYDQPQLFGFPFISNPYTDPVPLYTHTTMRLVNGARGYTLQNIGPLCVVHPITFSEDVLDDPDTPTSPQFIDIFEGSGADEFGWITWDPDSSNNTTAYIEDELKYPQMSRNDFTDADESSDISLSVGDHVSTMPNAASSSDINDLLQALVGTTIIVPVYDDSTASHYQISHFARLRLDTICLSSCGGSPGAKRIQATFIGYVDELCGIDP